MSHKSNRFPPTFDYSPMDKIILKNVMDKDINLIRDDKEYDILENVFGCGCNWELGRNSERQGRTFSFIKFVRIKINIEMFTSKLPIGKRSQYDEILLELSSGQDVIRSGINPSILVGHLNNMSGKVCSGTRLLCTTQRMKKPLSKNVFSYAYVAP